MKHYTAVSLRTNPAAAIAPATAKAAPQTELELAVKMALSALDSPVMCGVPKKTRKPEVKVASEKITGRVFGALKRENRVMLTTEVSRAAKVAELSARLACRQLMEQGKVTMHEGNKLKWSLRGPEDPAIVRSTAAPARPQRRGAETIIDRRDPQTPLTPITDADREILAEVTETPSSSYFIAKTLGMQTAKVTAPLIRLRDAGYVEMHSRSSIRKWATTGVTPPDAAAAAERNEIAGMQVQRVKSGEISVTLPATTWERGE